MISKKILNFFATLLKILLSKINFLCSVAPTTLLKVNLSEDYYALKFEFE